MSVFGDGHVNHDCSATSYPWTAVVIASSTPQASAALSANAAAQATQATVAAQQAGPQTAASNTTTSGTTGGSQNANTSTSSGGSSSTTGNVVGGAQTGGTTATTSTTGDHQTLLSRICSSRIWHSSNGFIGLGLATVAVYFTVAYNIWTGKKDFLEYCISLNQTHSYVPESCKIPLNRGLEPPPLGNWVKRAVIATGNSTSEVKINCFLFLVGCLFPLAVCSSLAVCYWLGI